MSKVKYLLRKLHIGGGGGFTDHHHRPVINPPPPTPVPPLQSTAFDSSSSSSALDRTSGVVDSAAVNLNSVDLNFFEEEFQVQLALAISVSDPDAREDPETAEIKAAKQISLGCSPSETLVQFISLRYWSYDVVNYDDKVIDGFYDVYGITSNLVAPGKMPSLVDLEAISVSNNVDYEVILVNRMLDSELRQLEERVYIMSIEWRMEKGLAVSGLIQRIADLVVDRMGGPVIDAEEMLKRWTARSEELRNSLNSTILPLGCLDFGLSRHRALLFKVLADRIDLPCMLVKGSYYTGTDDGAVNLIKVDSGSEYIIDLMGAPGTLIPAEVPSGHLQNSGLDMSSMSASVNTSHSVADKRIETGAVSPYLSGIANFSGSIPEKSSFVGIQSKGDDKSVVEKNQTEMLKFGKLLPHEGSSGAVKKASSAQKMKVKDVSKYVISAARNPEFAQKLHAVLLESGASPPPDLFSEINPNDLGEQKASEKTKSLNGNVMIDTAQFCPQISLANNDMSLIPFTGGHQVFGNVYYDSKQKHSAEEFAAKQQDLESSVINPAYSLPSATTSEGFVFVSSGPSEMIQADGAAIRDVFVDQSEMVARASDVKRTPESFMAAAANPSAGQPKNVLSAGDKRFLNDEIGKVLNNIEKEKGSAAKIMEIDNNGQLTVVNAHRRNYPVLGEVAEWEILWENLLVGERIGVGSYGEVYRAEWNGTEVAVKKFMNQDISGDALAQFKCEVEIMLRLRHPNLVLFMGAVTRPPNLSILTEFLPRGSLFKLLHRSNIQIDEKRRLRMALDVAKGMNYLHTSHPIIVHRDLKTPNLLVDKNWVVKICDFGMSRMKHHTFLSSKSTAGTAEWMAPEVLRNEPSNEKSDVYSFGVILWELATLQVPWTGMNSMQVVGAVGFQDRHLHIPADVDPTVAEIITDCWNPNQHARPTFGQIITCLRCLQRLKREIHTNQL